MVQATLETYKRAIAMFLPTPAKSHYVFNLRDFARVIRGVLLVPPSCMKESDKFLRLWVHEVSDCWLLFHLFVTCNSFTYLKHLARMCSEKTCSISGIIEGNRLMRLSIHELSCYLLV